MNELNMTDTAWKEVDGGFSCEPITYEGKLLVKVRPYFLEDTLVEFAHPSGINRHEWRKIDSPCDLHVVFNRDIYFHLDELEVFKNILNFRNPEIVNKSLTNILEDRIMHFIKDCYHKNKLSLEPPSWPYCKLDGNSLFDKY